MPSTDAAIISQCCAAGCGFDVVVLRARRSGALFCYCDACGCTWDTPDAATLRAGLSSIVPLGERAPSGVDLVHVDELGDSDFQKALVETESVLDWACIIRRINDAVTARN